MKLKWYHIAIFFFVLLAISGVVNRVTGAEEARNRHEAEQQRLINLAVIAESAVLDRLKAPSTAEFPNYSEYEFRQDKEDATIYYIIGYVEAENSFGANLRSNFIVKCRYANPNNYKVIGAEIE